LEEKIAQAELALSEAALLAARNDALNAESLLKGTLLEDFIREYHVRLQPTDRMLAVPTMLDLQEALRIAIESRPDLQAARLNIEKQNLQLKYDFNQLFPRLDLFGTYRLNGLDENLGGSLTDLRRRDFPTEQYGVSISFPLTMWSERNNYKASKAAKAQAILQMKQIEEVTIRLVEEQIRRVKTLWEIIPLTRERTLAAQAALEAEQKKLSAGKSTSFNVLSLASDLTLAQVNEILSVRDYNQALAELALRIGEVFERRRIDRPEPVYRDR
jgi:outer membrane protein